MRKFLFSALAVAAGASAMAGENLLPCETDFETTVEGWYGWEPDATRPERVRDGAVGAWSMELRRQDRLRTPFVWDALKPETVYTVSFFAEGDGGRLATALVTDDWRWIGPNSVPLAPAWKRHSYSFRTGQKGGFGRAFCFQLAHESPGEWFRIDGLKIEEGPSATPYEPRRMQFFAALEEPGEIHFAEDGAPVMNVRAAGADVSGATERLVCDVVDAHGHVQAAMPLENGRAALTLDTAGGRGYYPWKTRLRTASGETLACRETPFVVTAKSEGNEFFGIQLSSGVPIEALRRVGYCWVRANTTFWAQEEKDGPRPFAGAEEVMARKRGALKWLGTAWGHRAPQWALGAGRTMWADDVDKATNYLARLVHATTNVVDQYEVMNEPDLALPGETGVTFAEACDYYAKVVALTAKYVRPTGRPLAIDVSGVREGGELVDHVLSTTPESVDIVAIHPYSWPRELSEDGRVVSDPETGGFLDDLRAKTALLKKHGKRRMAIGELGWALDMAAPYGSRSAERLGWYLARMHLLARTFPRVEYLIWFALANVPENGTMDYGIWRSNPSDGTRPLPAVAAACEAARRIPAPGRGKVVALERDGLYLLAWKDAETVNFAYWTDEPLDEPLGVLDVLPRTAADCMGRELDVAKLTLSGAPVYLEVDSDTAAAVETALRPALKRAYAKRSAPVREEVRVNRFSGDWKTVDFAADPACVQLGGRRSDVCPPDPTVQWSGEADLSAKALLGWDDENFYFFAAVRDDVHCVPKTGCDIYMNDAIQLAFDPKDNAKKNAGYLPDDCEFGLCEGQGLVSWRRPGGVGFESLPGDFVRIVRRDGVTEYRAAIPWWLLGLEKRPEAFGFAFAILDNDDNERSRYWLAFGNGIADGKRPAGFKRAVLADGCHPGACEATLPRSARSRSFDPTASAPEPHPSAAENMI